MLAEKFKILAKAVTTCWSFDDIHPREYTVIIARRDYPELITHDETVIFDQDDNAIYRYNTIDSQYYIENAATLRIVPSYLHPINVDHTYVIEGCTIQELWLNHGLELATMAPAITYNDALRQCHQWVDEDSDIDPRRFIWYLAFIDQWYHGGIDKIEEAMVPTGIWEERYNFVQINKENRLPEYRDFITELETESISQFFYNQPFNDELFDKYRIALNLADTRDEIDDLIKELNLTPL